jgi:DsbE subfamily thiol:disulfide oxidoreductase
MEMPLPRLAGETVDGGRLDPAHLEGAVVVVNVWATWCGPCRREQPVLQRVFERYRDEGVAFVGIDWRDDRAKARAWREEFGVTYPSLWDPSGAWADDFGWLGAPTTYLADRSGTIRYRIEGAVEEDELTRLLDELLAAG